jgi:hypothetical protein
MRSKRRTIICSPPNGIHTLVLAGVPPAAWCCRPFADLEHSTVPLLQTEFDTFSWSNRDPRIDLGRNRGSWRETEPAQHRGQSEYGFSHGEVLADTDTRADSKWRIGKPPLRLIPKPTLRAESLRFGVPARIAM